MSPSCGVVLNPDTRYDASARYSYAMALHALEKSIDVLGRRGGELGMAYPLQHEDARVEFERSASYHLEPSCIILPHLASMLDDLQGELSLVPTRTGGILRVDAALEDKASNDRAYGEFAAAVASACASEATSSLGITGYRLDEKNDPESPGWLKMVLQVDFADGSFDSKRGRRIKLRRLINEHIRKARRESRSPEGIDEIFGRFFITVSW